MTTMSQHQFNSMLKKVYTWYTGGFILFIIVLAILEQMGLPRNWIGYIFLLATVGLYAGIGIMSRTADIAEYYVAGRRVPAFFNGMATGADWMSAASFIGMAGTLYLTGYNGLAFVMGWTGGYCLVALFLAPYLRKFGQFTIPDFLGARYGGNIARFVGICCAILCSFTYVVAQIYGVGLVTTRLTGVAFELGIFLGLGGILVCSFLGGMRAVTWTQVAQYIVLIIAYLIPVIWLSVKHTGFPIPQLAYGYVLQKVTDREKQLIDDPKEQQVRKIFADRAAAATANLKGLPGSYEAEKGKLAKAVEDLKAQNAPADQIAAAQTALEKFPKSVDEAKAAWTKEAGLAARAGPPLRHAEAFPGKDEKARDVSRWNFLALIFCLMVGTAALPHILMRYYTTPSVKEARESVTWSLFFIFLLYFTAPALGVLAKYDVYTLVVGQRVREAAGLGGGVEQGRPGVVEHHRRQSGRHRPARGDRYRRRHRRACDAGDRGLAVCDLGPRRSGWSRGRAVDRGRPAAHDRERALARSLLQDDRPACVHAAPRDDVEDPPAGGRADRSVRREPEAGRHPVPGERGVLVRGRGVFPGAGARDLLEARHEVGRHPRDGLGDLDHRVLHGDDPAVDAGALRCHLADRGQHLVWDPADLGGHLGRAARVRGDHHREPADARPRPRDAGARRARAVPAPARRHRHHGNLIELQQA